MISIFISYRRGISSGWAGRLAEKLGAHFGPNNIFMDTETLQPGTDFVEAISDAVKSCDVVLAIIAPDWVGATTQSGRRRLDDPHDFVRIEIASALSRGIRVIPVLVGRATMPTTEDLPEDLQLLARRQAHEISDTRWDFDCQRLINVLQRISGAEGVTGRPRTDSVSAGSINRTQSHDKLRLALALSVGVVLVGTYLLWQLYDNRRGIPSGPLPPSAFTTEKSGAFTFPKLDGLSSGYLSYLGTRL
jgi:TIR domain-containing protein